MNTQLQYRFTQFELTKGLINNLQQFSISPVSKLVLLYLSGCYNPKKADVFPKQKTIATKLGISERSVIRAIQELVKEGLILVETKATNRYKFTSKIASEYPDKMLDNVCQKVRSVGDNLSPSYIEQKKEQKKNTFKPFLFPDEKFGRSMPTVQETKELLKEIEINKQNTSSPLDYSREEAIKYVESLHPGLKKIGFAKTLTKKYNL